MKAVKIIIKVVVCLVILLLAAVLALPLWFGPVAKTAANSIVPGIVKTDFKVGHLSLNPYTARFELGSMNLGNPEGCSVSDAVKVGEVIVDAETLSLMTDVIHVEEITLRDVFVSVVNDRNGVLNFRQIQYNVAGGKEKYEAAHSEKETRKASTADVPSATREPESKADKPSKKIVIDRFEVSGLTLQLSVLPIRVPTVVLTDIGRKTGGMTFEEARQQILDGIMKSAGVTSDQLKALGVLSGDALKKADETVNRATAQATAVVDDAAKQVSADVEKAKVVADGVTKQLSAISAGGGTPDAVAGAVKGGAEAVNDSVKKAGDEAKKALDSLKSLW